ncbi:hypothetical protein OIU77_016482 [Salix suchowensis]|uniref:PGG domain-containing protein n=1 Tax=Salix suchowensis TaxID=1278906 RepID=A0ABQ8ZKI2_9ROSI|nr:hypothetical protein OIU77_016482 [Salix suchowensis]
MATDQPNIPENTSKNFYKYFRFKLGRDGLYPNNCTVVTSDNNCTFRYAGTSVLYYRNYDAYIIFVFFNTTAFSAATSTIVCLVLGSPFDAEVLISIVATTIAFCASVVAVIPPNKMRERLLLIALLPPYIFMVIYENRKGSST